MVTPATTDAIWIWVKRHEEDQPKSKTRLEKADIPMFKRAGQAESLLGIRRDVRDIYVQVLSIETAILSAAEREECSAGHHALLTGT